MLTTNFCEVIKIWNILQYVLEENILYIVQQLWDDCNYCFECVKKNKIQYNLKLMINMIFKILCLKQIIIKTLKKKLKQSINAY